MKKGFLWLIFIVLSGFAPLWAKGNQPSQPPNPAEADRQALAVLADVLENPQQRAILIQELRKLSSEGSPQTAGGTGQNAVAVGDKDGQTATEADHSAMDDNFVGPPAPEQPPEEEEEKSASTSGEDSADPLDSKAIKAVTENAKEAVASAVALPKKMAEYSADIVLRVSDKMQESWGALVNMFTGQDILLKSVDPEAFFHAARNLSIVIISTLLSYYFLRRLFTRFKRRMQIWAQRSTDSNRITRRLIGITTISALDAFALLIAYFGANVVAGYAVGTGGILSMQGAFFIRAFLTLESIKIGVRALFYPHYPHLRLIPCAENIAVYWNRWFSTLISLLGYGYLVAFKLIQINLSPSTALVFSAVLAISAFIYGITTIIRQRHSVRAALMSWAQKSKSSIVGAVLTVLAVIWHWLALGYFVMLLVLTLLRGESSLPYVLQGTLNTILIIGGGVLLSAFLTQYINYKVKFSPAMSKHLAGVERLLNSYIPTFLRIIRFILLWVVFFAVLNAWNVVDMGAWVASKDGQEFINKWTGVALIVILAAMVWLIAVGIIEHRLSPDTGNGKPSARVHTLLTLFKSGLGIILVSIATIMIMSEIGINIGPLIAGAGVLGLAVGFGAQKLVQDVITGIFIQVENAMNAGDIVTVDGITGTAERISIRTVGIRDISGTFHLIPFSNVTRVSNYMRGYANHLAEYGIAYRENIDEAIVQLKAAFNELVRGEMKRYILEPISIHGVTQLADSAVMIRVAIKTTPGDQWAVGRAYNRLVKMYFDAAGIEIPFPHTQIYFGEDKNGQAPPMHIRTAPEPQGPFVDLDKEKSDAPKPQIQVTGEARLPGSGEL